MMHADMENISLRNRRKIVRAGRELKVIIGMTYYPNDMTLEQKVSRIMHYRQTLKELTAAGLERNVAS
jgi:hypothetical protein